MEDRDKMKVKAQAEAMQSRKGTFADAGPGKSGTSPDYHGEFGETLNEGLNIIIPRITLDGLRDRLNEVTVLDVRSRPDYDQGRIEGAVHADAGSQAWIDDLPREAAYVIYGGSADEKDSASLARALIGRGFPNVSVLRGSFSDWKRAGFPVDE